MAIHTHSFLLALNFINNLSSILLFFMFAQSMHQLMALNLLSVLDPVILMNGTVPPVGPVQHDDSDEAVDPVRLVYLDEPVERVHQVVLVHNVDPVGLNEQVDPVVPVDHGVHVAGENIAGR
jgi:hypothetical protein